MSEKLTKPFTINIVRGDQETTTNETAVNEEEINTETAEQEEVIAPKEKLYLILKYYNSGAEGAEDYRDFEFFTGTTQALYDHMKTEIEVSDDLDIMRSRVLVDSHNITISHKCSIYVFMKDAKDTGRVVDNTSFDIHDYYYETDNEIEE